MNISNYFAKADNDITGLLDILGKLFPNAVLMIAHLIATAIIITLIIFFLWKPTKKVLNERKLFIQSSIDDSVTKKEEAIRMQEEASQELVNAKLLAEKIQNDAKFEGYKVREEIISLAKGYADKVKEEAEREITKERALMEQEIKNQIIDVAFVAAQKLIEKKLDENTDKKYIKELIDLELSGKSNGTIDDVKLENNVIPTVKHKKLVLVKPKKEVTKKVSKKGK